jgi:pyruvate kinase
MVSTDNSINDVQQYLKDKEILKQGDVVVNLASMPLHQQGRTNMVKVTKIS